jgi:hypothetical protein
VAPVPDALGLLMANVLLVVGLPGTPTTQDALQKTLLEGAGHTVTYADDAVTLPNTGYDVIVVAESGQSTSVALTSIPTCSLPVMLCETTVDTMRLATTPGTSLSHNALDIVATTHPIVSGLPDPVTVFTSNQNLVGTPTANVASGAVVVATHSTNAAHSVVLAAESGATLTSGTAPARRVWFGCAVGTSSVSVYTADANTLYLQAVAWAATPPGPPPAVTPLTLGAGGGFLLSESGVPIG